MKSKSFFLFLVLILALLCSCEKKPQEPYSVLTPPPTDGYEQAAPLESDAKTQIRFWYYSNPALENELNEIIREFNETIGKKRDLQVIGVSQGNITDLNSELKNAIKQLPGAQEMPDMFLAYADTAMEIDKSVELLKLNQYFSKEELSEFLNSFLEEEKFDSVRNLKILPVIKAFDVMFLNKTTWDEFSKKYNFTYQDISTWESVAQVAEKYYQYTDAQTPQLNDGKAMLSRDSLANYLIDNSGSLGKPILDVKNNTQQEAFRLDIATMKKLWDYYYIPYIKGYYSLRNRFSSEFDKGKSSVLMFIAPSSTVMDISDYVLLGDGQIMDIEVDVLSPPTFSDKKPYSIQQGAGIAIRKSQDENVNQACVEFLRWLTKSENNMKLVLSSGYVPVKRRDLSFERVLQFEALSGHKTDKKILSTVETTIRQVDEGTLYTVSNIKKGYPLRIAIKDIFENFCIENRQELLARAKNGEKYQELIEEYTSNGKFVEFFNLLQKSLSDADSN